MIENAYFFIKMMQYINGSCEYRHAFLNELTLKCTVVIHGWICYHIYGFESEYMNYGSNLPQIKFCTNESKYDSLQYSCWYGNDLALNDQKPLPQLVMVKIQVSSLHH